MNKIILTFLLFTFFLLTTINVKADPLPLGVVSAESISSGNWSNPSIWSTGIVPKDSTFVTIRPGHVVTLTANSSCLGLVIDETATLDNGIYELRLQLNGDMNGIYMYNNDTGVPFASPTAPAIDSTFDINNPNNRCWNIYVVNGTHAGSGDIKVSYRDIYNNIGGDGTPNPNPIIVSGKGNVTNTGTFFLAEMVTNQNGVQFNSACNVNFYCDLNLYSTLGNEYGVQSINYGNLKLKGTASLTMGGEKSYFQNWLNTSIVIDNGNLSVCKPSTSQGSCLNLGIIDVKNGDLHLPFKSQLLNTKFLNVNGDILGYNSSSDESNITNSYPGAELLFTGEIFPSTNYGTLTTFDSGLPGINFVIYNGNNQNVIVPKGAGSLTTTEQAYSVVIFANSGTKTLQGDISVNDSLIIQDNAIFTTSTSSYAVSMHNSSVWKNVGLNLDPFAENSGLVSFLGDNTQDIISNVSGGETFYDLTINNTAGGVLFNLTDVNVTDTLKLENGIVTTGSNKLYLTNPLSGSLSTFSDTSFINGNFRREIASNTDTYSFPLGYNTTSSSYYRADLINNNLVGASYIDANVNNITETGNNIDSRITTTQGNDLITDAVNTAIWNLTPDAQPSAGSYNVKLYTANITGLTDNMFFTLKRPNLSTDYADWNTFSSITSVPALNTPGRTVVSGYAERGGLSSFSEFAIGSVSNLTTGINTNKLLVNSITTYPNPAKDILTIDLTEISSQNITIELIDMLGNIVSNAISIGNNLYRIDRNNLAKGIYLLNVTVDQNKLSKKILFR